MRFGPDDKFWVVTDPTPESETVDILFQASLRDLELQFKGGLTMAQHPTLFTDKAEAEFEASGRLIALLVFKALFQKIPQAKQLKGACRVQVLDERGQILVETEF